jgi:Holliday junction resolvase-like predicted endonuclease
MRGETYGCWYFHCHGCIFVAENYMPAGARGELGRLGYDGETLAFVEIRTRTIPDDPSALPALPELVVTRSKQAVLVRTAQRFLSARRLGDCPTRFDAPVVRLHQRRLQPPAAPLKRASRAANQVAQAGDNDPSASPFIATTLFRRNRGTITHQSDPASPSPVQSSVEEGVFA